MSKPPIGNGPGRKLVLSAGQGSKGIVHSTGAMIFFNHYKKTLFY